MVLADVKVRQAKPAEQPYKLTDGNGLHLFITPAGGRSWRLRYQKDGKSDWSPSAPIPRCRCAKPATGAMKGYWLLEFIRGSRELRLNRVADDRSAAPVCQIRLGW